MAKHEFSVMRVDKRYILELIGEYHYLSRISKGFKSGFNYALIKRGEVVGAIVFTTLSVCELCVGMLGKGRAEQDGYFELSRLCVRPDVQRVEHNITSWFVARAIKQLRRDTEVKLILSYADSQYHSGTIYAATNFDYFGLTEQKNDFWIKQENIQTNMFGDPEETHIKHSRGKVRGVDGEWRPRSRKHRFLKVYDKGETIL